MSLHELDDEQRDIRALAARFADEVVAPQAAAWDKEHRFPSEVITQLGELGLMGVCIPPELGGAGADFLSYALVLEELSRGDAGLGVTLAVHIGAGALPIIAHGRREQIEVRNEADNLAYQSEKALRDNGDKIPAEVKTEVEAKVAAAREAAQGDDVERIKTAVEELRAAAGKIGEAMYQAEQQKAPEPPEGEPAGATAGTSDRKDGDTIEGEFKEQS